MSSTVTAPSVGFANALRAEWIKLRSLRSTWYALACLFVVVLGMTVLSSNTFGQAWHTATEAERQVWDPTSHSLRMYIFGQLILGVFAILVVTSEFATGLMGTTLTAMPRRLRVLGAKVVLAVAVAVVAGEVLMFVAFLIGQPLFAWQDVPSARLGDPGVLPAVLAGGVYFAAIALLAVGLGTLIRSTAGALATLVGIVFLVPAVSGIFPSWFQGVFDFWPTLGGAAVLTTVPDPDFPHPWLNLGGMCLGIAAVLVAAFVVFRRRDV